MNFNDSDEPRSCAMKSKYFTAEGAAMDDSLSDFQEPKNVSAGPKRTARPKVTKPKRTTKRPRGQKDIRTALKSTKKELENYSKTFDKVCIKAGIDVDSEELQLAIALSKSLHNTPSNSDVSGECSQSSTTQQRIGKIRTTLQEYGFKVPEIKIAGNTRRLPRKNRKNYKLIQTSDTEKKEMIADKFSQILFQDISYGSLYNSEMDAAKIRIYYLTSNVPYDILKITDTFYINNYIERSTSNGNLLRDWCTIPGRPESPKLFEPLSLKFSELKLSQDEIDVVLSGTIKKCRDIVSKKIKDWEDSSYKHRVDIKDDENETVDDMDEQVSSDKNYRSCSPDMFDDDASDLFEDGKNLVAEKGGKLSDIMQKNKSRSNVQVMDLTEAVDENSASKLYSNKNKRKCNNIMAYCCSMSQDKSLIDNETLSKKSNIIRESNNFVTITKCVASSSADLNRIDLTQSPEILERESTDEPEKITDTDKCVNNFDSTQSTHNSTENILRVKHADKDTPSLDLTQSSTTSDELPFISLTGTHYKSMDDTIIVDINNYAHINERTILQRDAEVHIDLTQCVEKDVNVRSQSYFEEYNHEHSESTGDENDVSKKTSEESNYEVNHIQSFGKKLSNRNKKCIKENNENFQTQFSKEASQIIVEPIPVEIHPANTSYKYPKPGKVDLTVEENCFVVEEKRPNMQGGSDNNRYAKNHTDDDNLSKKSETSDGLSQNNIVNTSSDSKNESKSNGCIIFQNTVDDDIDLTQNSDMSSELSQASKVSIPNLSKDHDDHGTYESSSTLSNKLKQQDEKYLNHDLTQDKDLATFGNSQSSLEKKENMSIDYDEFISTKNESVTHENSNNSKETFSRQNSMLSNCSQESEVFDLTDKELDYSIHQSKLEIPHGNFVFGGISIMDDLSNLDISKKNCDQKSVANHEGKIESNPKANEKKIGRCNEISPIKHRRITEIATPQKASGTVVTVITPKNSELVIKTDNVTPMRDYESMSTPDIHKELDKYGIKPFKRKRAIQLLTHIYHQTHPIVESADEIASPPKRHKPNNYLESSPKKLMSPRKLITSPRKCVDMGVDVDTDINFTNKENKLNDNFSQNSTETNCNKTKGKGKGKGKSSSRIQKDNIEGNKCSLSNIPNSQINRQITDERGSQNIKEKENGLISKEVECNPEDWVFQKREKAKVHSCRVPLHIAFYNYVHSRQDLREAILCYKPVEIDLIHKDLVSFGHRYDPKDLLKFLDKKCITVKTTDNDGRNQKR